MMKDRMDIVEAGFEAACKLGIAERAYCEWLDLHKELREPTSERRSRLIERDDHGEQKFALKVWWQVVGSFEFLHPEYEVNDYRDGSRFLDFAYIRPPYRISIEIDGFRTHQRNASRRKFGDDRFRQNQLVLDDWIVIRFSFDDVIEKPRQCQQFIQQLLGKLYGIGRADSSNLKLTLKEREIIRWAQRRGQEAAFNPKEVEVLLVVSHCTALKYLHQLLQQELLEQASGEKRIRTYRITTKAAQMYL
ncbi:DNA-binding response regulator [Paenibacillus alkaliterrae]|uniref:DNA-binding response regulator n=1 Tax=Paenibacillus alkaliterrae TaxID=320909 RepID=UPI001F3D022A|nr:DNA-binding response regulator [Paenibacillus alkaliterrae]MCF2939253.1 DNA-binding response regulator [Paenibacillus alkaliterrae]